MKRKTLALTGAIALGPLVLGAAGGAAAKPPTPAVPAAYTLAGGVTTPVYDYAGAIRETVWVDAPDLDGDGNPERIAADIIRPRELDGTARVPIIMDASPYYLSSGRGNEAERKTYDAAGNITRFPLYYDNYFVPRGYAFVAVDMAGTARSTGCTDEGGLSDIESVKAVVEWLAGKGTAKDAAGNAVNATWSSGRTGMIGKSYDGTLANGVAAAGTEGLTTIVPIGAISSWYDYNRYQGAVKSNNYPSSLSRSIASNRKIPTNCTARLNWMDANDGDESGAYTPFWAERDYREGTSYDLSKVKASVFVMHGLQDTNVKTRNFASWWEGLGKQGVNRKMWLTRLGHVDPFDSERALWVDTLHRWFDHELLGIDNGILKEPAVSVETAPNRWEHSKVWPIASARTQQLQLQADGTMSLGKKGSGQVGFVNRPLMTEAAAVAPGDNPNRVLFTSGTLKHEVRFSGTATVDLDISHTANVGQVSAYLVDYGDADRILTTGDGAINLATESCWGPATATDDACYIDVGKRIGSTPLQVIARGWARLDGAGQHNVTVSLDANDVVIPAGHQLGLVVLGVGRGYVLAHDNAATPYTVNVANSKVNLPISGPMAGLTPGALNVKAAPEGTFADPNPEARPLR